MNDPAADQCTCLEEGNLLDTSSSSLPLGSGSICNGNLLSGKLAGGNIMLN